MKTKKLDVIHESLINGQRKQMVAQIEDYGLYDFWEDYKEYLQSIYSTDAVLSYFSDATISYFRIKNR